MPEAFPINKTAESIFREATGHLLKLQEMMPDVPLPAEPWDYNKNNRPVLPALFSDIDFILALEDDPASEKVHASIYALFKEAETIASEVPDSRSEQLAAEITELLQVYDEETLDHLKKATTWELAKDDMRRIHLRDNVFRPLQAKMTELVTAASLQEPDSMTNPAHAWFWKNTLPAFLKIRSVHGRYIHNTLRHDMPDWQPLLDTCNIRSNNL